MIIFVHSKLVKENIIHLIKQLANWLSSCTFNGFDCVVATTCQGYTSIGFDDSTRANACRLMKDTTGTPCGFVIGTNLTNCIDRACNNAPTPFTDFDCYKYKDNCTISNATTAICIEKKSNCTSFQGFPA